jgi:hypothetical protein
MRKIATDDMQKAVAKDALQKAVTYAEQAAANRHGAQALEAIKAHVAGAGIKIAHLKPLRFLERDQK